MHASTGAHRASLALLVATLSACGGAATYTPPPATPIPPPPPAAPKAEAPSPASPSAPTETLESRYRRSIAASAVEAPSEARALKTVTTPTVTAVAWTGPGIYKPNTKATIPEKIWAFVTIVPEVKDLCATWSGDKNLRLQQLLGLPPDAKKVREFATLTVQTKDLFRPCTNPDPSQKTCAPQFADDMLCLIGKGCSKLPKKEVESRSAHVEWMAFWSYKSWKSQAGYPFTGLGYTYDWAPDARADHYGASEFVVRPGSVVEVKEVASTDDYCRAAPAAAR